MSEGAEEARFRRIFRRAHAGHAGCVADEWLMEPCRPAEGGKAVRSLVWSRRNGPWRRVPVLWVGAAPGNAGGRGSGPMGAHATRIPFGGDIAGANLDLLLRTAGLDRNSTFMVAALNQLPDLGGGEPKVAELRRPVGEYPSSVHLLRDTLLAAAPRLVVALGNIGLRSAVAAAALEGRDRLVLPSLARLGAAGLERGVPVEWPGGELSPDPAFLAAWRETSEDAPLPHLLWLLHPSAQNMSPYAGVETAFHQRMVDTRRALVAAVSGLFGRVVERAELPWPEGAEGAEGIYALPEWHRDIGPRHRDLIALWRQKGV